MRLNPHLIRALILGRRILVGAGVIYGATVLTLGGLPVAPTVFRALVAVWVAALLAWQLFPPRLAQPEGTTREALRWWARAEVLLTNLVFTVCLAEVALRGTAAWAGRSTLLSNTLEAYQLAPGHDYGQGLRGNRLGFPGPDFQRPKPEGVLRIAALGDSFAIGPAVPFADNYLTLLGSHWPGVELYNFGVSGSGPREYETIQRQAVWAHEPDLVLVSVFIGNDITETLATPRNLDLRQHSLYLALRRGWRLLREQGRQGPATSGTTPDRLLLGQLAEKTFREVEARRLEVCIQPPPARIDKRWRRALAYLDRIVQQCRQRRVPVAFVLIPDEFQVNPVVLQAAQEDSGIDPEKVDLDLPQRRLREFCVMRGVPCLDLRPVLAAVPETYAPRDTHWNVRGNHLAAAAIAAWLPCTALLPLSRPGGGPPPPAP